MIDYQKIFEGAPALFVLLGADESFRILDASDAYLRATHSERDAIVGRSLFEVFPDNPEEPEATGATNLRASLKRVLADGRPDTMAVQKYDVRRPTGAGGGFEERYWSPVNAPVFGPDGRMLFIVHRVEDVTEIFRSNRASAPQGETMRLEVMLRAQELQEANRQLREVTEQFQAIYDQGLFAGRLRLDGTVLDANRSAVEVCGFDRADILDKPFWDCGWWNRSPEVQAWIRNAVEQAAAGELFRGESLYFWGDGSEHIVDFACVPVTDATGRVVVVVTTGMDVTERVRAEQNQRELARVTRLTTMGEMTASIAHEVNQPLMAIVTNADSCLSWLSRDAPEIDEARMAAARIVRDGHRAGDIIKTIRALARKSRLEMTQLDINDALAEVLALTRGELRRHDISLETELSDGLPPVLADRIQVQQVILNLVMNGIEAMNAIIDRPRLLRVGSQIEGSGSIQIAVADTGTGLDPAKADRVFDAFFTTKPDGMGMGLSICRSIVGAHGGRIWASSNQPYGSVFQFSMPTITKGVSSDRLG